MKAAFNWKLSANELAQIERAVPEIERQAQLAGPEEGMLTAWERRLEPDDLLPLVTNSEILVALSMIPRDVFRIAESLRFVSSLEHGVNWLPFDLLEARGVQVANARGARDAVVAEQAFALLLACAKRLIEDTHAVREVRFQQNWSQGQMDSRLAGEKIGIVGLGGIGREIAHRAKAFDMRVLGVRRDPLPVVGVDEVFAAEGLGAVLARSKFVVLVAPYTPLTRRLMNEDTLRSMRPDAYLINMARAALVDERAIHRALTDGWIAGYATDVWWDYGHTHFGVPSRLGVHQLSNVIGTGDRSINVPGDWERVLEIGLDNVRTFLDGRPLTRLVNLPAGY
jgi:phosphoglycerate dehydrogenase-like enzyme